jgi:hypothetical protein
MPENLPVDIRNEFLFGADWYLFYGGTNVPIHCAPLKLRLQQFEIVDYISTLNLEIVTRLFQVLSNWIFCKVNFRYTIKVVTMSNMSVWIWDIGNRE